MAFGAWFSRLRRGMRALEKAIGMFRTMDRAFELSRDGLLLVGRLAMSAIFIPGGFSKLTHLDAFAQSLGNRGVPGGMAMAVLAAAVEFFGSLAVAIGFKTRWAALLMAVFTIVATLVSHRYWELQDATRAMQYAQFMKNLAIAGGFLALSIAGAGKYRIDPWTPTR
jgi:putative oxidoreductase